jgi:hydrophobe/amphiphile efflux-1 (HAE1) family protein
MQEVTGPVVAIVLVLAAVFVPVAFMGGLTGRFYQQFAITIALSVAISGLVALTLSPALCRLLLKPHDHHAGQSRNPLALLFRGFNWSFDRLTAGYGRGVALLLRHAAIGVVIFAALGFATWKLFEKVPTGFIPAEDQGYVIVAIQLPPGSSLERTEQVMRRVEAWWQANPATDHVMALSGYSALNGINSTAGCTLFVTLKDWNERLGKPGQDVRSLLSGCWKEFGGDPAAIVIPINPSPVPGLGTRVGFEVQLQATAGQGLDELAAASDRLLAALRTRPEIDTPNMAFSVSDPQLRVDVDREQVKASGLALGDVFSTLQAQLGSLYVNDFVRFGRVWRVQIQADPAFRDDPARIGGMYIRNKQGEILPLASVVRHRWQAGPNFVSHFNSFAAATITGANAAGWSTGDAMRAVREEAAKLPSGFQLAWSGSSYQEIKAGSQAGPILAFGLLIVVLILMAQYESVRLPVAVLLAVPLGILGAMGACWLTGLPNNIYVQIGLLVLVGLAAKNAILIVEFAAEEVRQGRSVVEAAQNAARLRLRPILMTSLAFILGVLPLAMARGAGAAGRVSIGIAVLGGMIAATVLAVFLVPLFFRLVAKGPAAAPPAPADPPPPAEG